MECRKCGKETFLPFKCPYCGGYFCTEHRLPENHNCPKLELARAPTEKEEIVKPIPLRAQRVQSPYEYTITYIPVERKKKLYFSSKEIKHLAVAALLVLGIGFSLGLSSNLLGSPTTLSIFAITVTASFLTHELAHKFAAQKAGLWAEFRLMFMGLVLTAISIISPVFKIISPGAVLIFGFAGKNNIGKISMAGPTANIVLSAMLAGLFFASKQSIFIYASAINAWIALFNLIPFGILDGHKIFAWNKGVWSLAFTTSLILTVLTYVYLPF
ncbi:MAG: AN1-type zinc finger domain-containing protein [Candidatus Bathyarchaeia archaeon]